MGYIVYGDRRYSEAWSKLKSISLCDLVEKEASWHRSCYKDAVQTGMLKSLSTVFSTLSAGESLRAAIDHSGNDKLRVKLSTAVDANDATSIDIKYHKNCWVNNVTNVLRKPVALSVASRSTNVVSEIAGKIELLVMAEMTSKEGKILMSQLQEAFESTLEANNVVHPTCSRKVLKQLLQHENTKK